MNLDRVHADLLQQTNGGTRLYTIRDRDLNKSKRLSIENRADSENLWTGQRARVDLGTPRVNVREDVSHVSYVSDSVRDQHRQVAFSEMYVHVPQTGDEKLPSSGNGARTLGDGGLGIGIHNRLNAIAN